MKILITGAAGFVGHKLLQTLPGAVAAPSLRTFDERELTAYIRQSDAEVIIHTAAIADMGVCQADPAASYRANVLLPVTVAAAADGKKLICFSTDQVYNGSPSPGPYTEDMACPANVYAAHKLEMEQRVLSLQPEAVLLRAEWMYDGASSKGNYYKNILAAEGSVAFSPNQYRGVTYLREVAENMPAVIRLPGGVYNFGSETALSMYELTSRFVVFLAKPLTVEAAPARHNLWMDCTKAKSRGIVFSDALAGVMHCAEDYGQV